jgi:hypothetical protein
MILKKLINWINYKKNIFLVSLKKKDYKLYFKFKILEVFIIFIIKKYFYYKKINKVEFKKFSQNGEDGVIKFIFNKLKLNKINSIEIGFDPVENNSIYNIFICKKNCLNFFVEMSKEKCLLLKFLSKNFFFKSLNIVNKKITTNNINKFVLKIFQGKEIDLFSIDIDGLDYYILRKINFFPKIIILEYNKYFQKNPITVLNKPNFQWKGRGDLYWGASIVSMDNLLKKKGYFLVYLESSYTNAFYIRNDYVKLFKKIDCKKEISKLKNNKYSYYKWSDSLRGKKFLITD